MVAGALMTQERLYAASQKNATPMAPRAPPTAKRHVECTKNQVIENMEHIIWDCPASASIRNQAKRALEELAVATKDMLKSDIADRSLWPAAFGTHGLIPPAEDTVKIQDHFSSPPRPNTHCTARIVARKSIFFFVILLKTVISQRANKRDTCLISKRRVLKDSNNAQRN